MLWGPEFIHSEDQRLLLARLGLRSSEVVFLELDDIDWTVGQLSVRGKRGHPFFLPVKVLQQSIPWKVCRWIEVGSATGSVDLRRSDSTHGRTEVLRGFPTNVVPSGLGCSALAFVH